MRFDTVIVGGGLAGFACGLALQKAGQRTAVVSVGQSTLHFSSGALELLGSVSGQEVGAPLDAVKLLPDGHPYRKLGDSFARYAELAEGLLSSVGIAWRGSSRANHYRLTPLGGLRPAWLSVEDIAVVDHAEDYSGKRVGVVNFEGFLDFPFTLLGDGIGALGAQVELRTLEFLGLSELRQSATEYRAVQLARYFAEEANVEALVEALGAWSAEKDLLILPAVFDLDARGEVMQTLRERLSKPVGCVATLPPSVVGDRIASALRSAYTRAEGVVLGNCEAVRGDVEQGRVERMQTTTLGEDYLRAENFVLATGKFYSSGVLSSREGVREKVLECDVISDSPRDAWLEESFWENHAFSRYGVQVDDGFRVLRGGAPLRNAYAIGSVLGGFDALAEGSGGGVALLTALRVADAIVKG